MKRLLLVIFCLSTFFVHNTVLRPDIMEVRNLVTAHEMFVDGHWLVPTMNGEYRLEKPPLPTWVAACVELVFGDNLAMQRAMAGVMGLLLTLFLYLFALRLTGRRDTSLVAALMLMTCYTIILQGRTVTWDIYCHAFMMGAVWLLCPRLEPSRGEGSDSPAPTAASANSSLPSERGGGETRWLWASLLMGLSFMSKGPVAFLAVLLPALIALNLFRETRLRLRWTTLLGMVAVVAVLSGWWYLYVYLQAPEAMSAIAHKESTSWVNHNVRPWWYYWRFFLETGVWAPLLLYVMYRTVRSWRSESLPTRLAFVWMAAGVVLLSLFPEKKMRYLMPLMMPCCLLMADWVCCHWSRLTVRRLMLSVCALFFIVECAGLPLLNRIMGFENRRSLAEVRPTLAARPDIQVYYVETAGHIFRIDMAYHVQHRVARVSSASLDSLLNADSRPMLLLVPEQMTSLPGGGARQAADLGVFDNNPYASGDSHYNPSLINRAWLVDERHAVESASSQSSQ